MSKLAVVLMALSAPRDQAAPPAFEFDLGGIEFGASRLESPAQKDLSAGASQAVTASWLARRALPVNGWYFEGGLQAENFLFSNQSILPKRLQDYAAILALEYYEGEESAASLTLRPGWYFAQHATGASWDLPVDLAVGVPIIPGLNGVVGFSNARFYHHALPVFGLVWTVGPHLRVEAIYPEPAVVYSINKTTSLRVGGELTGAGFLAEIGGVESPVEYVSYRVGVEFNGEWKPGYKVALGAGVEAERSFDFFRRQPRLHGSGAGYVKLSAVIAR